MKTSFIKKLIYCLGLMLFGYFAMEGQRQMESTFPREINEENYQLLESPPGTIKVNDSLFCDETEVANVHYREYMYWVGWAYGKQSKEYHEAIPDSTVWKGICDPGPVYTLSNGIQTYGMYYLANPECDFYPLVGITQKQAVQFTKWRADRVFERLLIDLNKITEDRAPTKETCFTIERYFNGALKTILPGKKVNYYPDYTLPTLNERELILARVDSANRIRDDRYNKHHKKHPVDFQHFRSDIEPCTIKRDKVTIPVKSGFLPDEYPIYNLRGNVAEWAAEKDVCAGGSWIDNRAKVLQTDTAHVTNANAWTGFRNVCVWRKWGK